jgi:hypothetical protein
MFGTHQAIVTVAAGMLQKAGLITYARGSVGIESHTQLENGACEQIKKWKGEVGEGSGRGPGIKRRVYRLERTGSALRTTTLA